MGNIHTGSDGLNASDGGAPGNRVKPVVTRKRGERCRFRRFALKYKIQLKLIQLRVLPNRTIKLLVVLKWRQLRKFADATPGQSTAVGAVLGAGFQYRPMANVSLFVTAEGTAMSDKSHSVVASSGARVSF
jgi:hypothetical protein